MSIKQLNNFSIGDENFTALFETVNKAYKGKNDITLSNYDNDSSPLVKVGSVFDNNGALFIIDESDITPNDYGTISISAVFYLYHNGVTNVFEYSETVPFWDDEKQGWYNVNNRALFSMVKDSGGTLYLDKLLLLSPTLIKTEKFYEASNETEANIYTQFSKWLINSGDSLTCEGQLKFSGSRYSIRGISRSTGTNIRLIVNKFSSTPAAESIDISQGQPTVYEYILIESKYEVFN